MAAGFQVFNEQGQELFDSNLVQYGLTKAGYLQFDSLVPWYFLRSVILDPTEESSWAAESIPLSPVWSITVDYAISPVAFVSGQAVELGQSGNPGGPITFYYQSVVGNPKILIFDLMRDRGTRAGFQSFDENGQLVFTSEMPSLNIVGTVTAPPPGQAFNVGGQLQYQQPYVDAQYSYRSYYYNETNEFGRRWTESVSPVYNPTAASEVACRLSFSRNIGTITRSGTHGAFEGCVGGPNARFIVVDSAVTTNNILNASQAFPLYVNIPTDRYPEMQIIDVTQYPFPFN